MALKEEKVLVTSGKKQANVRRETSAVSCMKVTIVHNKKNEATLSEPPMTRGRSVSKQGSTLRVRKLSLNCLWAGRNNN